MARSLLTLTAPNMEPLPLSAESGLRVTRLDVGSPEIRGVVDRRPGRSGTDDHTTLHGARLVTITAQIHDTPTWSRWEVLTRLGAYCHPGLRPTMLIETDGRAARAIDLRAEDFSPPLVGQAVTEIQVSWVAPSGLIRSADPQIVTIPVQRDSTASGRSYDWSPDRSYPHADPPGLALVHQAGTAPAPWLLRIYGYCITPRIETDTGEVLVEFGTGPVPQHQYWECDSVERTVFENSLPTANRRNHLRYVESTWCELPPGDTTLLFTADNPAVPCKAEIEYYDQWLI